MQASFSFIPEWFVQDVIVIRLSENLSIASGQTEWDLIIMLKLFFLKNAFRLSAPKFTILFCFYGSRIKLWENPLSSSFSFGSLQSKSITFWWFSIWSLPSFISNGLYICSIPSISIMVGPIPPWQQKIRYYLSVTIAAKGICSNASFILAKQLFGSLMSSPNRFAHSSPNPRYLFTFLSSWFPLKSIIYFGNLSFRAIKRQMTSKLYWPLST